MAPAPKARVQKGHVVENPDNPVNFTVEEHLIDLTEEDTATNPRPAASNGINRTTTLSSFATSPKATFIRRNSSVADGNYVQVRGNVNDMREHLKHLGPSNLASRPKATRYQTVKIKPAHANRANRSESGTDSLTHRNSIQEPYHDLPAPQGGDGEGLLKSAGRDASDGVQALQQGYGSTSISSSPNKRPSSEQADVDDPPISRIDLAKTGGHSDRSSDTLDSLNSLNSLSNSPSTRLRKRGSARSGSITENIIEAGGVRKVVLETNSSSDDKDERAEENTPPTSSTNLLDGQDYNHYNGGSTSKKGEEVKKKRRRIRKKKGSKGGEGSVGGSSAQGDD
jgi:metal transporter CNNM